MTTAQEALDDIERYDQQRMNGLFAEEITIIRKALEQIPTRVEWGYYHVRSGQAWKSVDEKAARSMDHGTGAYVVVHRYPAGEWERDDE